MGVLEMSSVSQTGKYSMTAIEQAEAEREQGRTRERERERERESKEEREREREQGRTREREGRDQSVRRKLGKQDRLITMNVEILEKNRV
jgi:hypothetical protein